MFPKNQHRWVILFIGGFFWLLSAAVSALPPDDYAQERLLFLKAEKALQSGQKKTFLTLSKQLRHYPLYPMLLYEDLRGQFKNLSPQELDAFEADYPDSALAPSLKQNWLRAQASLGRWAVFLQHYDPKTTQIDLQCHALWAQYQQQQDKKILEAVKPLWLVDHAQPSACHRLFHLWESLGFLNTELVWQRIDLLLKKKKFSLAKTFVSQLPKNEQHYFPLWERLRKNPSELLKIPALQGDHRLQKRILIQGVGYWSQQSVPKASAAWEQLQKKYRFTAQEQALAIREIALSAARQHLAEAPTWLARIPESVKDDNTRYWQIRTAIAHNDWPTIQTTIETLSEFDQKTPRWQYWLARALEETDSTEEAFRIFSKLAQDRSYYGFLASERLQVPYTLNQRHQKLSQAEKEAILHKPCIQRTLELFRLGRLFEAKREWMAGIKKMKDADILASATLAEEFGWHHFAVIAMSKANNQDDIPLRFPLAHSTHVLSQASAKNIDPAWIFAVTRQESAFAHQAKSPVGALGLMQVMPKTAKEVARRGRIPYRHEKELLQAELNIKIGSTYLQQLFHQHEGNLILATAAYNAGPLRVQQWLPHKPLSADQWIETIPFTETRDYVQNVLAYIGIYRHLLGKDPLLAELTMPVPAR